MQTQTQPPLMRLAQVLHATCLKRSTIYKMIGLQTFPAPVKLTSRSVAWRTDEVNAWIEERPPTGRRSSGSGVANNADEQGRR